MSQTTDGLADELTLPSATWLEVLMARLFGKHKRTTDSGWVCHTVRYKHRTYVLSIKEAKP